MGMLADNKTALSKAAWLRAILAALFLIIWFAPPQHAFEGISKYQSFHLPVETASLIISMLVFGVAWNAYSNDRASNIILTCASLAVGLIDFAHMLSFAGMPDWATPAGPQKGIDFWLAACFIFAAALLLVALRPWTPLKRADSRYIHLAGILSKPARLNEIEYSFIKTHPQSGYDILKGIDFHWPVAEMVLQHHERMDGSGHPQGLMGEHILPERAYSPWPT